MMNNARAQQALDDLLLELGRVQAIVDDAEARGDPLPDGVAERIEAIEAMISDMTRPPTLQ